jgi:hypothetical protein
MILYLDTWFLPAVAASSSSYLICLAWERIRPKTAPSGFMEVLLAALSFLMGAFCAVYRHEVFESSLESNVIVMFGVAASTTFLWLLLRKFMPRSGKPADSKMANNEKKWSAGN